MGHGLSYAHGGPLGEAVLKASANDFCVTEQLGFEPAGSGEHVFLWIQKRGLNTQNVLDRLRRIARVRPRQLGYCGLKDRIASTRQWFSVHLPAVSEPDWRQLEDDQLQVLAVTRHQRKLRIGAHQGNHFNIRLRDTSACAEQLEHRCSILSEQGFPNYFGAQRFGIDGANLDAARRLFSQPVEAKRRPSHKQRLYISAARAHIFNAVAAGRVADGSWRRPLQGDVFQLDGSGSLFSEPATVDIVTRLNRLDLHITGPLWGGGELLSSGAVAAREQRVAAGHAELAAGLAALGLHQQRRALRAAVRGLRWQFHDKDLLLQFDLGKGSYATSLLRELVATDSRQPG